MSDHHEERLTGWKEIAGYLRKDVRTVLRWERQRGLPIHRPPGRRGQSVYAFRSELDAWIRKPHAADRTDPDPPVRTPQPPVRSPRLWLFSGLFLAVATVVLTFWPRPAIARVEIERGGIRAFDARGRTLWTHPLEGIVTPSVENGVGRTVHVGDVDHDDTPEAIVSILATTQSPDLVRSLLLCFDGSGRIRWSLELDDVLTLDGRRFGAPWAAADLMVFGEERKTLVLTTHHLTWSPSMILRFDAATGERQARYVHPGWVMRVDVTQDRQHLVAAAINSARDAQAVAVLRADDLSERSYFLLPRPDGSAVTREPLDRQHYWVAQTGAPTVRFGHSRSLLPVPETIVEFSPDFRDLRATHADSYWEWHRTLERKGHLHHAAERCPERTAPLVEPRMQH